MFPPVDKFSYHSSMGFERIAILGVGLMGGSIGLAIRSIASDSLVIGYSNNANELQRAIQRAAIHQSTTDAPAAVRDADLIMLCTPIGCFAKLMREIAPDLKPTAIVTDVGSTKRAIQNLAAEILPKPLQFVGSHPMVGGEKHGIENARADLFIGGLCIISPAENVQPQALQKVDQFWRSLKMRTVQMSAEDHDRMTADISHLPHAIAAAMVRIQSADSLKLAARGFLDSTRIAAGDSALWRDILLENRDNVRNGIVRLQAELQELLLHLDSTDPSALRDWLAVAAEVRAKLTRS